MSPVDNNLCLDAKRQGYLSSFTSPRPRSSVGPPSDPSIRAPRRTMHGVAFVPRPFPPPALADVPIEYIIAQLRQLAPHYWRKPETSDCTIVVPLDTTNQAACSPTLGDAAEDTCSPPGDVPSLLGFSRQQEEEPAPRPGPRMVMQLHMDYLCAHSTLIRGFMSGASPFELMETTASSTLPLHPEAPTPGFPDSRRSSFSLPAPQFPCMLPSPPTHPSVYLPVPDPASFRLLVHYVYFGSTSFIEDALDDGTLSWEGLARNVEYLGMGAEIKVFLGRWYGRWRHGHGPAEYTSDSDSDSDMDMELRREREYDSDTDQELELPPKDMSAATSPTVFDPDDEYRKVDDDEIMKSSEPSRGRKRTPRRLVHSWSEPGLDSSVKEQLRTVRCRSK